MNSVAEIFATYRSRLLAFIRSRVRTAEDAQDILQEVFLKLIVSSDKGELYQVSGWLYETARNRIIDHRRKASADRADDGVLDNAVAPDTSPEDELMRSVILSRLFEALDELPETQYEAYVETELNGLSFKELSEKTGVPVKTLLSRKHYAVLELRKRLRTIYEELSE